METAVEGFWHQHRVSYGETDMMGVLYYGEYLHIFERSRNAYIRSFGISYALVEERGLFLPVREAACRYRSPARYDELLQIRMEVEWSRASLTFNYAVFDEDRERAIATGMTQHACVNGEGRPVPVPDWFRGIFG